MTTIAYDEARAERARKALLNSGLPYGLPDFAHLTPADYEAAILAGLDEVRAEINAITANPEPPTLANTLSALELAGQLGYTAWSLFHTLVWSDGTKPVEEVNARVAPLIANLRSELLTNVALYERMAALSELPDLPDDARYLLEHRMGEMRRAGVELRGDDLLRLHELDEQLASLEAKFGRQLLAASNAGAILVTSESELSGLTDDVKATLALAAAEAGFSPSVEPAIPSIDLPSVEERGSASRNHGDRLETMEPQRGPWLIKLELPTQQSILASLESRDLRRRIQEASENRGLPCRRGFEAPSATAPQPTEDVSRETSDTVTTETITQLAKLRAERANLLGFPNHAAYIASNTVVGSTEGIDALLNQITQPALDIAKKEEIRLTEMLRKDLNDENAELQSYDWKYYAEQVRKNEYDIDFTALKPYLEFNRVLNDGVFFAANKLYGLNFKERPDLQGYHKDVKVYEIFDGPITEPNEGLALLLYDAFARPTKRGGAWMNALIPQSYLRGNKPIIAQNLNILKAPEGQPTLVTWDNVRTMFHEFGHALHGMFSEVYYPTQSGTSVSRDFVEYPSQVNEMWLLDPEVINNYARHYETGAPVPEHLVEQIKAAGPYGQIFRTAEMVGAVLLDQAWHRVSPDEVPSPEKVKEFEAKALEKAGVAYDKIPPRYLSTFYSHIWSSGYSAAYYAYLNSEMFDADTVEWYAENGGLIRANGERFRREVLSRGNTRPPLDSFRALRGRDPIIQPLLNRRAL